MNWDPSYKIVDSEIQKRIQIIQNTPRDNSVFIMLVKDQQREIVGLHWLQLMELHQTKCAYVISLWVSEKYRHQGIGRKLKQQGETWAKTNGAHFVWTKVFYENKKMINFNLNMGFSPRQVEMIKDLDT